MAQMTAPDLDLRGHVENLLTMVPTLSPSWHRIVVAEHDLGPDGSRFDPLQLDAYKLPALEGFDDRWAELLECVDRTWINLTMCDIRNESLIIGVEGFFGSVPIEKPIVSVNLSGFMRGIVDSWAE